MWNKIAGNAAPQMRQPAPAPAPEDDDEGQEMAAGSSYDVEGMEGAEGEGGPQEGEQPEGQQAPRELPPEMAQHVDPNNPLQAKLLQRALALTPEDATTFFEGITAPAIQVLKKLIPELGFIFDQAIAKSRNGSQQGSAAGVAPAAPAAPGALPTAPAPQPVKSRLFGV